MNKHLFTILKLGLVVLLMWWVLRSIHYEDRLQVVVNGEVESEQTVEIQGHWKGNEHNDVEYRLPGETEVRTLQRDEIDPEGRSLEIVPGFWSYWQWMNPVLFVCGALLYVLTVVIAGARWWWLLKVNGTDVSLRETLRFTWIGVFFNGVMPGATGGDVVKALYIMKRCPGHRVQVLVSVAVDRVLGLGSLALLGAIVVLFALDDFGDIALAIWGVIVAVGLLGVVAFSKRLRQLVRLKPLLDKLPGKVRSVLQLVDRAVFFYRDQQMVIAMSLLAGVVNHVLSVLCVVCLGHAIGVGMPTFEYFVLVPVINIVSAIPLGPNGWGLGDMMYGWMFKKYGAVHLAGQVADPAVAMQTRGYALSLLYRLLLTFFSALGGLFLLFEKDRVTKADVEREMQREQEEAAT